MTVQCGAYSDYAGIGDMAIELKEVTELDSLLSPVIAADAP